MIELSLPNYEKQIESLLHLGERRIRAALQLLDEGNTIPFIARYRKEMTGALDENHLRDIVKIYTAQRALFDKKVATLRLLSGQGVLDDAAMAAALREQLERAMTVSEVEDIYRPYRPKKRTRASVARERGLEPLLAWMQAEAHAVTLDELHTAAAPYAASHAELSSADAIAGALDIFAEQVADDAQMRRWIRHFTERHGRIVSKATDKTADTVYKQYYTYAEPLTTLPPHRVLAMDRGEREEALKVTIDVEIAPILSHLGDRFIPNAFRRQGAASTIRSYFEEALADAYKRLIAPSISREVRNQLTEKAHTQAISIFGENLRNLLLQPPLSNRVVLGVDPAYRTGCKLAVIDETGKVLHISVIYPTPPQSRVADAESALFALFEAHRVQVIAIGNGTASRETELFIAGCTSKYATQSGQPRVPYVIVSEAGASVYSASVLAGEEFPSLDVAERSAISIARRLQDPLAELVKIDPKAVGVGQYQHDVAAKELDSTLTGIVESVVNAVGVDVNTASPSLLAYVAGLTPTVARNIAKFREESGRIQSRAVLAKVPRMGPKTLEQCVGFLRIHGGDNVLDSTPIHPESYAAVTRLLNSTGASQEILRKPEERQVWIDTLKAKPRADVAVAVGVGIPTLEDILASLERPNRDPREDVPAPILRMDVMKLEDLSPGMVLTGTVRNVVDFGAFVDVGVKTDGLVHVSRLANHFVKHPMQVVAVGDVVTVQVMEMDVERNRLSLTMKDVHPVQ